MKSRLMRFALLCLPCLVPAFAHAQSADQELQREVLATERAFAKTMATRDFAAFQSFVSEEAVFLQRDKALHGREQIAAAWRPYYMEKTAPFSWEPERVEVLASGTLAISTGPVRDENGKLISTFSSIWRRDAPGVWHIVFDKGNSICFCER